MENFIIYMKIILKNHRTTDSVVQWVFWVWIQFCPKSIFLWIFHFEIHTHPIIQPNPFFGVELGGFDRVMTLSMVCKCFSIGLLGSKCLTIQ
jgi:hypothetical protein